MEAFLCDDVVYKGQDFAGAPLEHFPMVDIFRLYDSDQHAALEKFRHWMQEWLLVRQGWKIPKRKGGMAKGSLYTLVHYDDSMNPPITCVQRGESYMIKNGHHRAAALLVLGFDAVMAQPM